MKTTGWPITLAAVVVINTPALAADTVQQPLYAQTLFGSLKLNDSTLTIDREDALYQGDLPSSIPYLGAVVQAPWRDGVWGYGWEGGGFFSWQNESVDFYAKSDETGGTVRINVDNNFWSIETFMGLYGSIQPIPALRLYASAGPLFLFATTNVDDAEQEPEPEPNTTDGNTIVININDYDSDFTVGGYARAGIDVRISHDFWLGFSARHMRAKVDLDKTIGEFDIDGIIYLLAITKKI